MSSNDSFPVASSLLLYYYGWSKSCGIHPTPYLEFISFNLFHQSLDFIIIEFFQSFGNDSIFIIFQLLGLHMREKAAC